MTANDTNATMAVYLDLENIVIGIQDARYPKFDIQKVLERLLLKGHIVTKKAYCDWERYKEFKRALHETAFEMIEVPHLRQSGKNSADIRMVVDALDLCYTKGHVDTFVILSGDSDFSPLVSKLRENAKKVIGMGVKNSTSNLFITNCDEFIYYDDLVRKEASRVRKQVKDKDSKDGKDTATVKEHAPEVKKLDQADALQKLGETIEALSEERDADDPIWGSMIKQALKRRDPGFNERAFGFKSFNALLEEAQRRGLVTLKADEKAGNYNYAVRVKV
ncbi:MAG: NYN domain-containing protein [Roseimicrobium sp.]